MKTDSQKEWNFNFGIYANDDSLIEPKKCEELMELIVKWAQENNFSVGGGFVPYVGSDLAKNLDS